MTVEAGEMTRPLAVEKSMGQVAPFKCRSRIATAIGRDLASRLG